MRGEGLAAVTLGDRLIGFGENCGGVVRGVGVDFGVATATGLGIGLGFSLADGVGIGVDFSLAISSDGKLAIGVGIGVATTSGCGVGTGGKVSATLGVATGVGGISVTLGVAIGIGCGVVNGFSILVALRLSGFSSFAGGDKAIACSEAV